MVWHTIIRYIRIWYGIIQYAYYSVVYYNTDRGILDSGSKARNDDM